MRRKKFFYLLAILAPAMVFFACAGGPKAPKQAKTIERLILDYKGADVGAEIPGWVEAAIDDNYEAIMRDSRFKGKMPIVDYGYGQNLDLLRSWVNNFNVQAGISRRIANYVEANFGGEQLGNKNSPENINFVKELVATFSSVTISGAAKEMDYWIKLRTIDRSKKTETEQYSYYVVYSISQADLDYQVDRALGRVAARTQEQRELKAEVEDAMKHAALQGIEASQ
jgi:hypothetical protein